LAVEIEVVERESNLRLDAAFDARLGDAQVEGRSHGDSGIEGDLRLGQTGGRVERADEEPIDEVQRVMIGQEFRQSMRVVAEGEVDGRANAAAEGRHQRPEYRERLAVEEVEAEFRQGHRD